MNRGPQSLETLRFVRALGANATVVLGNHDLHLLALAYGSQAQAQGRRHARRGARSAGSRSAARMAVRPAARGVRRAARRFPGARRAWCRNGRRGSRAKLAREVEAVLRDDARTLFDAMYGNKPDRWSDKLRGMDRLRFVINVFTRMRFCTRDGTVDLKLKGAPGEQPEDFLPWFDVPERASRDVRVICGHWSTLGFKRRKDLLALDTGCVWGGALTAVNLDAEARARAARLHRASGTGSGLNAQNDFLICLSVFLPTVSHRWFMPIQALAE